MSYGIQVFDSSGNVTFDSSVENILSKIDEQSVPASSIGSGSRTYSYPGWSGKKICAFIYNTTGDFSLNSTTEISTPSCRITYPSGVPTVTVSFDNTNTSNYQCDGNLVVFYTGASQ